MDGTLRRSAFTYGAAVAAASVLAWQGCTDPSCDEPDVSTRDPSAVVAEVEAAVWAFHAADTARDAEAVIGLLWPQYEMLVDGQRIDFGQIVEGSREFLANLELFHTAWSDLRIIPIGRNFALSSFQFRDSIVTYSGELIRTRGPTTLLWERRNGVWRILYGDADHYSIEAP